MLAFPMGYNAGHIHFLRHARGASLIVVMLILIVVSVLGVSAVQISMMGERATRNDRDLQVAWQSAEAALVDAGFDIEGLPAAATAKRSGVFKRGIVDTEKFEADCGTSGQGKGLCEFIENVKPAWLTVDFSSTATAAASTAFGTFTDRHFAAGISGIQPATAPRYVVEAIIDPSTSRTQPLPDYVYRVTSMGFGPNLNTQVVLQMIYRN